MFQMNQETCGLTSKLRLDEQVAGSLLSLKRKSLLVDILDAIEINECCRFKVSKTQISISIEEYLDLEYPDYADCASCFSRAARPPPESMLLSGLRLL
jgi:hypothetical protein